MRAVDENAFDSGLGVGESQQLNNLNNELGIGIGGGSGVGISYGGGGGGAGGAACIVLGRVAAETAIPTAGGVCAGG